MTRKYFPFCFYVLVSVLCLGKSSLAYPAGSLNATSQTDSITPLKIGDKIPDELWDYAFPVVSPHADQVQYLSLGDFRDKLIILDFWATWCSSCIAAMPDIHEVADSYPEDVMVVPVTLENAEKTSAFLKSNEKVKHLNLSSIINGEYLKEYFPHRLIPHMVWIGGDGKVLNFSTATDFTNENVELAINGMGTEADVKDDMDTSRPLFSTLDLKTDSIIGYSVFINGYQAGLPFGSIRRVKDNKVCGLAIYNASIGQIYQRLYRELGLNFKTEDIELLVDDPEAIWLLKEKFQEKEWRDRNLYTIELIVPKTQREVLYRRMLEMLNSATPYNATVSDGELQIRQIN